jgi:glycosyltransferase involved in cell wall biosynthesis
MIQDFPTGIGNYLENLIKALAKLPSEHRFVLVGNRGNKMESWSKSQLHFKFVAIHSRPNSIHQHFLLPLELSRLKLDLFWTTPWGASLFLSGKYALTIYDLLYRRYPEIASLKAKLYEVLISKWVAGRAAVIFTISEFVKNDIVNFLGVKKDKIFNIKGAAAEAYQIIDDGNFLRQTLKRYKIAKPFFTYLGNFRPHKNLPTLLKTFAALSARYSALSLVLVGDADAKGRDQDSHNLLKLLKELNLQNEVILTGRVKDDREVAAILNEAVALVHPSFHEGFGLTVLEAMSCGCPVIATSTTSIPEVAGDAGILVDPGDVDELTEAMSSLYYNYTIKSPKYQELQRKSLEQAKKFSWEKTATKVLEILLRQ